MGQERIVELIAAERVVAIVRLPSYEGVAVAVATALRDGGISAIEFTYTGEGVASAIAAVKAALGGSVVVGAGTVVSSALAEEAIAAGAAFLVTPIVQPEVIRAAASRETPVLCGAMTPTEVFAAHAAGATMVKVFPASRLGPAYIKDLLGPFPSLKLVPTGGIDAGNAREYLDAGAVAVGIGGRLIEQSLVTNGNFAEITRRARACVEAVQRKEGA